MSDDFPDHRRFSSIGQFKNAVKNILHSYRYIGDDENGKPMYDATANPPIIQFTGTVKIHGTNAGIRMQKGHEIVFQSRDRDLTLVNDNAGFAQWGYSVIDTFAAIRDGIMAVRPEVETVFIYGEWYGPTIHKGVGVNKLPSKRLAIFDIVLVDHAGTETHVDLSDFSGFFDEIGIDMAALRARQIDTVTDFPTFSILIDATRPELVQNELVDLTMKVEASCPVARYHGFDGVGEGIVWSATDEKAGRLSFKVKGEEHQNSHCKTLAPIDSEAFAAAEDFAKQFVTAARINQAIDVYKETGKPLALSSLGDLLRWITSDIIREEQDNVVHNNIDPKKAAKAITMIAKPEFIKIIESA